MRWFSVRKEPKDHGAGKTVEGNLKEGDRVAVLDDVATQGSSTIKAIERCRQAGFEVVQAIVLVDREAGGLDKIRAALKEGASVEAVFRKSEIKAAWDKKHK